MTVERANPSEMRKAIEMSNHFVKHGVYFVPVPVCDDLEELLQKLQTNLEKLAELADDANNYSR